MQTKFAEENYEKISKVVLASALAVGLGLGGVSLAGCGEKPADIEPSIEVYQEFKTEYAVGEALDVSLGVLTYTDENGDESRVGIQPSMVSGFNSTLAGERELIITYNGCTISIEYLIYHDIDTASNVAYVANPSYLYSGQPDSSFYDYFLFKEVNNSLQLWIQCNNVSPENIDSSYLGTVADSNIFAMTGMLVNGKMNYTGTMSASSAQMTFVVEDANTISVSIVLEGLSLNYEAERITY